jgi:hypothetical protein
MIKIRVNHIEFRDISDTEGQFVQFTPNQYFGKLQQYLDNGWEDKGDRITCSDPYKHSICKSLFDLEETSVGDRLLYAKTFEDFMEVYRMADKKMMEMVAKDKEQYE